MKYFIYNVFQSQLPGNNRHFLSAERHRQPATNAIKSETIQFPILSVWLHALIVQILPKMCWDQRAKLPL